MPAVDYNAIPQHLRNRIEELSAATGWSLEQSLEEILIEAVAMGGLSQAGRPKAKLVAIDGGVGPKAVPISPPP